MNFAACFVPVAPLRAEASHKSEMISQLLFGECVLITDSTKDFFKVTCMYDNYEGWCAKNQLTEVDEIFYQNNHQKTTTQYLTEAEYNHQIIHIPSGSFIGCTKNNQLSIGNTNIVFKENSLNDSTINIEDIMFSYLNTPYLWGGKSVFGIDCSGFVQQIFKTIGVTLSRDAYQQAEQGSSIGFLQEVKIGDLAFFDNEDGRITHVGIILDDEKIIHASGSVRIDKIDNAGIIHSLNKQRTHNLRLLKRLL
ncbi:MAG: C40 family peptidase [Chitinophagales bacterium]|nr:C40 family peptidase [Chitinophagales bacterium]